MLPGTLFNKLRTLFTTINNRLGTRFEGRKEVFHSPEPFQPDHSSANAPHLATLAKRFEGKLLLREEILLSTSYFKQLQTNHYFLSVPAIQQVRTGKLCIRCQNTSTHLFASIPCKRCHQTHSYCRSCIQMGRVLACESLYRWNGPAYEWECHDTPCTWLGELTYAQQIGANRIKTAVEKREQLISWAVTGAGKTEMLFPAIEFGLKTGMRICVASPRADVIRELLPRFRTAFRDIPIQGLYGGSHDKDGDAQLILATTHQLFRYEQAFDLMIIDEVDAFPYHQDPALHMAVNRAKKTKAATIFLTATPRKTQMEAIDAGKAGVVFIPMRYHGSPLIMPQSILVPKIQQTLENAQLPKSFQNWLEKRKDNTRQLLIFVPTIALAPKLEEPLIMKLKEIGLIDSRKQVTSVHAEDLDRQEKVEAFRQKQLYALLTTTILERGVTFPSVDVIVLDAGHQVFDEAALVQISGRAGRSPKDPNGEVIFYHDGLTDAIVHANTAIVQMNNRRKKLLQKGEKS